jgi:hypothetical protein
MLSRAYQPQRNPCSSNEVERLELALCALGNEERNAGTRKVAVGFGAIRWQDTSLLGHTSDYSRYRVFCYMSMTGRRWLGDLLADIMVDKGIDSSGFPFVPSTAYVAWFSCYYGT